MASLYIHIPFCQSKCAYCDFASYPGRIGDMARYLSALENEMADASARYGHLPIETAFIGGGTPSLLSADQALALGEMLDRYFDLSLLTEFTIEANPGTVTPEKLSAFREMGANRISFGAQAMQGKLLESIGRIHRWGDVVSAVRMARDAGFRNINLDLMFGLPGQTKAELMETLGAAVSLGVEHLSCYSLILEESTPLYARVERGEAVLPDEDTAVDLQRAVIACLANLGYARYEISNFAKPGYECAHNIVYWTRGDYLGLGCAAHSLMAEERFENDLSLDAYLSGARGLNRCAIPLSEQREEAILLETRHAAGLDLSRYADRYGEDFLEAHREAVNKLRALGLIELTEERLHLTEKGFFLHNAVVLELLR